MMKGKLYFGVLLSIFGAILWSMLAHTGAWWIIGVICFDIGWMCLFSGLEDLDVKLYELEERIEELEEK